MVVAVAEKEAVGVEITVVGVTIVREAQIMAGLPQVRVPVNPEGVTFAPSVVHVAVPRRALASEYMATV